MLKFVIIVIFLIGMLWFIYTSFDDAFGTRDEQVAAVVCTDDIGFCDDGSSVMRSGPNCQFAACQ